jgi:hypothetical protein
VAFVDVNTEIDDTDEIIFGDEISQSGQDEYNSNFDMESDDIIENTMFDLAISDINSKSNVFNKSAILPSKYDKWYKKIKLLMLEDRREDIFSDEEEEEIRQPDIQMPRVLQALADLVERYRRNTNDVFDPPMITKKKEQRVLQKRNKEFMETKGKQMVIAIVGHLEQLIIHGGFQEEMFGNYVGYAKDSISSNGYESLHSGLKLVMCAEIIIPSAEMIQPVKRISSALPTGVN